MANDCDGCKFWSELIAKYTAEESGALCLNRQSPHFQKYTQSGCDHFSPGRSIDDPCPIGSEIEDDEF